MTDQLDRKASWLGVARPPAAAPAAGKVGGMEMMLRTAGLGAVLDAANQLAASGALGKILAFADQLPQVIEGLERIERELAERNRLDAARGGGPLPPGAGERHGEPHACPSDPPTDGPPGGSGGTP